MGLNLKFDTGQVAKFKDLNGKEWVDVEYDYSFLLENSNLVYEKQETFTNQPLVWHFTMTLISKGKASFILNGKAITLTAPCLLLISQFDSLKLVDSSRLEARSCFFTPTFLNRSLTFEVLANRDGLYDVHILNISDMFLKRNEYYDGTIDLSPQEYVRISEWFDFIGSVFLAGEAYWPCRIRSCVMQILFLLEENYYMARDEILKPVKREKSPVDIVLEYIHINYADEITLDTLCQLVHMNRTTLSRKFKEHTGQTPMSYLLSHRLKISRETLTHTALSISELAESLGFQYDTYFIRQFTVKMGLTPTEYRQRHTVMV